MELQADCLAGVWAKQTGPTRARASSNLATSRRHLAPLVLSAMIAFRGRRKATSCLTPLRTAHPNKRPLVPSRYESASGDKREESPG